MSGVNKVIIIGRLGADPEVRTTTGGTQVCTLSIATSETWVKDGKKEEKTEWHRVILWGRQAELAQKYLKKGRMVYIEGRLQTRSWQDQQGQKRYTTEIVANNLQFIDGSGGHAGLREGQEPSSQDSHGQEPSYYNNTPNFSQEHQHPTESFGDDIPF